MLAGGEWFLLPLFGDDGGLVRYGKGGDKTYYQIGKSAAWLHSARFIHMRFAKLPSAWFIYNGRKLEFPDGLHGLYVISSNLVEDQAINCLTCIWFNPYIGDGWTAPIMRKDIPLPDAGDTPAPHPLATGSTPSRHPLDNGSTMARQCLDNG